MTADAKTFKMMMKENRSRANKENDDTHELERLKEQIKKNIEV
jgi:hypothetical protein